MELYEFVENYKFERLGCFTFEAEPGTRSALMPQIPAAVARARKRKIMTLQKKIIRAKNKSLLGSCQPILFLGAHPETELLGWGRLWSQAPEIDGETIIVDGTAAVGAIAVAKLLKCHGYDFEAAIIT
jgi:tRNA A37 methylthiotransferase MiaB